MAFDAAMAGLRSQEATLRLWRDAKAAGKVPRFTEWTAEKKAVGSILFESLKALFVMERPYYRLLELKSLDADSEFERILLGFDADGISLLAMDDAFGQRTEIRFADVSRNAPLDPGLFRFTSPPGADVVGEAAPPD